MKQILYSRSRIIETLIHIIGWGIVFAFPFVMMTRSGFNISLAEYLRHGSSVPLSFLSYSTAITVPHSPLSVRGAHTAVSPAEHTADSLRYHRCPLLARIHIPAPTRGDDDGQRHIGPPKWIFILRDLLSMILTVGLSAAIR